MENEIWKDVPGWEEFYEVSTIGRVWSKILQRIVYPKLQKGYLNICIWRKDRKINTGIHRIVAITFIPNPENKPCVNHKKGIKFDNRSCELEWCTYSENTLHSIYVLGGKIRTKKLYRRHGVFGRKFIPVAQYDMNGNFIKDWEGASKARHISHKISSCCKGKIKYAGGFIWKYKKVLQN